ncbi:MAG: hypothetical protein ACE5PM_08185 [Candidatus Hydrothermarchaeales archaeon]
MTGGVGIAIRRSHEEILAFTLELFSEEPVGEVEVGIGRVTVSPLET